MTLEGINLNWIHASGITAAVSSFLLFVNRNARQEVNITILFRRRDKVELCQKVQKRTTVSPLHVANRAAKKRPGLAGAGLRYICAARNAFKATELLGIHPRQMSGLESNPEIDPKLSRTNTYVLRETKGLRILLLGMTHS